MEIKVFSTKEELGKAAALEAKESLNSALDEQGQAVFITATGASQFEFLEALCQYDDIRWDKTVMFHLDEYIGIDEFHPASFRKYLNERLINKVNPGKIFLINGSAQDPDRECGRMNAIISKYTVDIAFVGIGENGHLAFNDPPADFNTEKSFIVVKLDEKCRNQQFGEGWFHTLEDVPKKAISMSIKQIMKTKKIICIVPDKRKAMAVKNCLEKGISPEFPASILRNHPNVKLFLDRDSSSLLKKGENK